MKDLFKKIKEKLGLKKKRPFDFSDDEYFDDGDEFKGYEDFYSIADNIRGNFIFWVYLAMFVIFIVLIVRLWTLQIIRGEENLGLAEGNRIRTRSITAPRGLIYSRDKEILAKNVPNFSLVVYPQDLSLEEEERNTLYRQIEEISNISFSEIKGKVEEKKDYLLESIVLKENIKREEALILEEKTADLRGVAIEKRSTRGYIKDAALAHALGYVGDISGSEYELNPGYLLTDKIGKVGLEKFYEKELKGANGKEQVEVDSKGLLQKILAKKDPKPGSSLVLNIDLELQKYSKEVLMNALSSLNLKKGVVIVSDPRDGSVLSIVSLPDFDNNIFTTGDAEKVYPELIADESRPLFNRVISGTYPSGSVVKPVVAAGALSEGIVGAGTWIDCHGEITVPHQYDPSIIYRFVDWQVHGSVNIIKAIAESCNVFFYHIGGGHGGIKGLGLERLIKYFRLFGLGKKTGVDLFGEVSGLVPDAEWKEKNKGEPWVLGDTYHLSIGQGDLNVTPLQVNAYTQAIANGGKLYKPRLAKELLDASGKVERTVKAQIKAENFISDNYLSVVRQGMRACVTGGSCHKLSALPVSSAGKTGTAQAGKEGEEDHAWFTAFAPYENPEIAITVLIENGIGGYETAEPVARDILYWYFTR